MPTRRALLPMLFGLAATSGAMVGAACADLNAAPEFTGIERWLNTDAPVSMAALRGKVVLVDFWTYSCINCRRTVPYLNRWQAEYGKAGLQVVGIHTPEFGFERAQRNVEASVRSFGIQYPVGQDNRSLTWHGWRNRAWPAFYLVDQSGRIVLVREGEGHAAELERSIRVLLGMKEAEGGPRPGDDPDLSRVASAEVYFGATHPTPQDPAQSPRAGQVSYTFAGLEVPRLGRYQLDGTWEREGEALVLRSGRGRLRMTFSAAKVHLVASGPAGSQVEVRVDGKPSHVVAIDRPDLYTLLDAQTYAEHRLEFEASTPGLAIYSATFG
jgi:thiol-disulfide isomerase/thioredoxin